MIDCFISQKKEKIVSVFAKLGENHTEESSLFLFKEMYPSDWKKINDKWLEGEASTQPGKKHPMQHPDIYMKEMYRNHKDKQRLGK